MWTSGSHRGCLLEPEVLCGSGWPGRLTLLAITTVKCLRGLVFHSGLVDLDCFCRWGLVGPGRFGCFLFGWRSRSQTWFRRRSFSRLVDLWDGPG